MHINNEKIKLKKEKVFDLMHNLYPVNYIVHFYFSCKQEITESMFGKLCLNNAFYKINTI